jgi:hypothetical protein
MVAPNHKLRRAATALATSARSAKPRPAEWRATGTPPAAAAILDAGPAQPPDSPIRGESAPTLQSRPWRGGFGECFAVAGQRRHVANGTRLHPVGHASPVERVRFLPLTVRSFDGARRPARSRQPREQAVDPQPAIPPRARRRPCRGHGSSSGRTDPRPPAGSPCRGPTRRSRQTPPASRTAPPAASRASAAGTARA